jgi:hypothetical protein
MSYMYEQLGAERFQEFCQALLLREYPHLHSLPVGQPDGGRDALSLPDATDSNLTIIQVKFRRQDENPSADWMISALTAELPKIQNLAARGATQYIMMTNASSTAHLDAGRHDRVQQWLDAQSPIPASVYWRGDIDRRLEVAPVELKLSYPSIMTGEDAIVLLRDAQASPERDRIARTLKAFVSEQFRKDKEIKFRQVDLTATLLDLFVDVSVNVGELMWGQEGRPANERVADAIRLMASPADLYEERGPLPGTIHVSQGHFYSRMTANAADMLLDHRLQRALPWVVLQGAPGQGKSTLAQYVCQVHRARYLANEDFISKVAHAHADSFLRLPIKVDLRDLASYLEGKPYLNTDADDRGHAKSLEAFLASVIAIQSGGRKFSVDDFAGVAAATPVLLFFDGLDEVADLKVRKASIDSILQGLNRLKDDKADVQVVVTTRPSLYGRKQPMGRHFGHLELAPISTTTVFEYAEKWMLARGLDYDRASEIRSILNEKLDQPHIRDLTRNPMQLAILLNLIYSIGHSLPDARTSLYSEYVKLFMTREAEKSLVVRKYRAVISAIVELLAWTLQAGAETSNGSGSVSESDLRLIVRGYLERAELDLAIADAVFRDGIERVWVLVQRVEGRFEFEVQPLREYFAAKHLYSTAPTLNFRHENKGGDRSQRFEGIAANPYWANVVRFYSGFYQPGEIDGMSASLKQLASSEDLTHQILARAIALELLTDWIFILKVSVQRDIVNLVFDDLGVQLLSAGFGAYDRITVPEECGRAQLASKLAQTITAHNASECGPRVATALARNGGHQHTAEMKHWAATSTGQERTERLSVAFRSGARFDDETLELLIEGDGPTAFDVWSRYRLMMVFATGTLVLSDSTQKKVLDSVLDTGGFYNDNQDEAAIVARALSPESYRRGRLLSGYDIDEEQTSRAYSPFVNKFYQIFAMGYARTGVEAVQLSAVIEAAREEYGDRWSTYRLAAVAVGYFPMVQGRNNTEQMLDESLPLLDRAMLIRSYRGTPVFWKDKISADGERGELSQIFWLVMLLSWAPARHVQSLLADVAQAIDGLSEDGRARLMMALRDARGARRYRGGKERNVVDALGVSSSRTARALYHAFGDQQIDMLPEVEREQDIIARAIIVEASSQKWKRFRGWVGLSSSEVSDWLETLRGPKNVYGGRGALHHGLLAQLPVSIAEEIVTSPKGFATEILQVAYQVLMAQYEPEPVGDIATKQQWVFG